MRLSADENSVQSESVRAAFEAAGQTMFEYDPVLERFQWADSKGASALLNISSIETVTSLGGLVSLMQPDDVITRESTLRTARLNKSSYTVEYSLVHKDRSRWFEERGTWLTVGEKEHLIGVIRSIDEQKTRESELAYLANYDELTGQLNRSRCREILENQIEICKAGTQESAYLLVGIDNLGSINNDFGFDVADEVIVEVARRMEDALAPNDALARVAGTKFGIVIADGDATAVRTMCTKLLGTVRENVIETSKGAIPASICVGATPLQVDTISSDMAMAQAEAALDSARSIDRSNWASFTEKTETVSLRTRNTEISDVILTALNDRRVCIAYQPIVTDLNTPIMKYECLVRIQSENGYEVPAPDFVPAAERLGLVHLLDRRVLELATQTLSQVPDIALCVNISWETAKDPVWAEGYIAHLRANRAVANRITVELTETQAVDQLEASIEFINQIKELGCSFALDDFGAGYTSFRNLRALDIDILKIDGSFVTGVSNSRENQIFVRTLLDLARNFGMKTVAEWVDNDADAILLKGLGVDYLQGYYIGKPEQNHEWTARAEAHAKRKRLG